MIDDRAQVFASIREALAKHPDKAALPEWQAAQIVCNPPQAFDSLAEHFRFKFEAAGGFVVEGWSGVAAFLEQHGVKRGYVDPAFSGELNTSTFHIEHEFDRSRVDEYEFGITRAAAGVAESGSIVLSEKDSSSRIGALAPWIHVAVLETNRLVPDIPTAIANFGDDRATAFVTGPSKTADVEGILIKGVHGPGIQVCCLI
jgi:L-lactate dehydrogenase complex protein LldG